MLLISSCVFTKGDQYKEVLRILNCVSKSGDQQLCDGILTCNVKLAKPYKDAYNDCVKIFLPNGIGHCDENSELYLF
ncbi:hypothetical protein HNY73_002833 [Argiope bruennichi]|uniref:Uncharacterized protein n=1 Tax=Argiope bruennichi TaxID=94029 RepID=A0A8T0FZD4_ARGBR|nr:hypothetical protein HNY73_002833 [Argiope bruennichi]